ncbi:putative mfs multidrug resistance [Phaeomoniella chlamydospora]|uniref:Putative mfs multidrug resistance n=1 Tax=Phaeomoniella chlamydospora TaxID=158046 RepID=A0A0G2GYD8_PHACM|nr:putative mfs multidrug resistance [Phaeomoniella chlamydospora]
MSEPEKEVPLPNETSSHTSTEIDGASKDSDRTERPAPLRSSSSTNASSGEKQEEGPRDVEAAKRQPVEHEPYPPAVHVPRLKRRGILAQVALLPEVENPYHYTNKQKWTITFIVAMCGVAGPFASGIILPALTLIIKDFNTTSFIGNLTVATYMLAMAIFPLWWSAFSEQFGRRSIYVIAFSLFIVFGVLSAISTSIGMFIAMRLLNGGASAAVQAVGAGTIADIWEPRERGKAMGIFYLGPLCGPLFAPVIGGGLTTGLGIILVFVTLALPETLHRKPKPSERAVVEVESGEAGGGISLTRVSTRQSVKIKSKKYLKWFRMMLLDPLAIIGYLRFPPVALTVYYASMTFGALYLLNISLEYTFSRPPYNFATWEVGFVYFPSSFGYLVTSILGGGWMDRIMRREAIKAERYDEHGRLIYLPEDRMRENAYIGAVLFPVAMLWYGWAAQEKVMWVGVVSPRFTLPFYSS